MAAAMTMEREPEVARFIDTYKFDQQMSEKREKYGGGTSLPLHSDGYEDKQRQLRDERHKEWMMQQEKPQPQSRYYRVGTPEEGLPGIGSYEKEKHNLNLTRQREYNDLQKKQRQLEKQRMEARKRSPPRPSQAPPPQMDYQQSQEQARAEERRAYQDYMGKYQYTAAAQPKPVLNYEENRKILNEERRREYNQLMEKKSKEERYWAMRGRPVTPPGGLDIGQYDRQVKEQASQKKKEYKDMLDQQKNEQLKHKAWERAAETSPRHTHYREQERPLVGSPRDVNFYMREKESKDLFRKDLKDKKFSREPSPPFKPHSKPVSVDDDPNFKRYMEVEREKNDSKRKYREELLQQQKEHMFLRARQEPEVPVLDRSVNPPQNLASKPPPGPSYRAHSEQPSRQTPAYWNEGQRARSPLSLDSEASRHNQRVDNSDVPLAFRTESNAPQPIPDRPIHGQPPYPGEGQGQSDNNKLYPLEAGRRSPPRRSPPPRTPPRGGRRSPAYEIQGGYSPSRPDRDAPAESHRSNEPHYAVRRMKQGEDSGYTSMRKEANMKRQQEYNEFLAKKNLEDQRKREEMHHNAASKPAEPVKNPYYNSDNYENYQKDLHRKQKEEYQDFLNKQYQPPAESVGLPLGQYVYEPKRLAMEAERNKDYNDMLKKQRMKDPPRRHDYLDSAPGPYNGLFHGLGEHGNSKEVLSSQRRQEYNDRMDKYSDRGRSPGMRNPQGPDHYQQMLDEKRREEAQRRRFDDPEYQGRLAQNSRDQQRYNY